MKTVTGRQAATAIVTYVLAIVFLAALLGGCTATLNSKGITISLEPAPVENPEIIPGG